MRESAKDVSALTNPMTFRRLDGRTFDFMTVLRGEVYITRVYDHSAGGYLDEYEFRCKTSSQVKDYIDDVLMGKTLSKLK